MGDRKETDDPERERARPAEDAELSGRLRGLDAALGRVRDARRKETASSTPDRTSTGAGMTLAFRMGSEFVAGVLVGAGLGWGIDKIFGIAPWGMIVLMLLGFGAGIMNMLRASGELGRGKAPPPGGS
ncbi:MAG TPA: AtpZ/AtpI family protein [Xanthobacteraceae bacterium]|nr:AtpZ/AtpI family protein [Xanthobacteraceae bacterium]